MYEYNYTYIYDVYDMFEHINMYINTHTSVYTYW